MSGDGSGYNKCVNKKNSSGLGEIPYWRYSPRPVVSKFATADPVQLRDQQYSLDERRSCSCFFCVQTLSLCIDPGFFDSHNHERSTMENFPYNTESGGIQEAVRPKKTEEKKNVSTK